MWISQKRLKFLDPTIHYTVSLSLFTFIWILKILIWIFLVKYLKHDRLFYLISFSRLNYIYILVSVRGQPFLFPSLRSIWNVRDTPSLPVFSSVISVEKRSRTEGTFTRTCSHIWNYSSACHAKAKDSELRKDIIVKS